MSRRSTSPQAAIGPGMAVYTRCAKVLDAAGNLLSAHGGHVLCPTKHVSCDRDSPVTVAK